MSYLFIGIGSALGGMARYWCAAAFASRFGADLPWLGIVAVNVIGSFLIGAALGLLEPGSRWTLSAAARDHINQFFMIGVLGGYTTFSSFSLWTLNLMREQQWLAASANVILSVVLCLLAVWLGFWLVAAISQAPRN
ncbi:MAG TPA: fluoride efflux transporter CrcB [Steroidobacteraceae bacterium]|nr:fluoride efflux transporter CrcB [Steroidobacteraceae bacterium]